MLKNKDQEKFKEWNERMFAKYPMKKQYFHSNFFIRYTENKRIYFTLKFLNLQPKDKILSVGCGVGYLIDRINQGKVWGIDLSEKAIKEAKKRFGNKKNLTFLVADALNLPFPNNFFDKIECSEVIEHVLNPKKLLAETLRVAKPEADIVFTIPNELLIQKIKKILFSLKLYQLFLKDIPRFQEWHLYCFNLALFKEIIPDGLKIIETKAVPFNFFPIRYIIHGKNVKK